MSQVSIRRFGHELIIQPAIAKLRRLLRSLRHGLIHENVFGAVPKALTSVTSSSPNMQEELRLPAGLEPVLRQWLGENAPKSQSLFKSDPENTKVTPPRR